MAIALWMNNPPLFILYTIMVLMSFIPKMSPFTYRDSEEHSSAHTNQSLSCICFKEVWGLIWDSQVSWADFFLLLLIFAMLTCEEKRYYQICCCCETHKSCCYNSLIRKTPFLRFIPTQLYWKFHSALNRKMNETRSFQPLWYAGDVLEVLVDWHPPKIDLKSKRVWDASTVQPRELNSRMRNTWWIHLLKLWNSLAT